MMRRLGLIAITLLMIGHAKAQIKKNLTLDDVINMAIIQSPSVKYVQNQDVNSYWRYKNSKAMFRPQLMLYGDLPNYINTVEPVVQPEGNTEFKSKQELNLSSTLSLNQPIAPTGGTIYAASSLYRVQDYNNNTVEFSGNPFKVGFSQPIFSYNWMKWYRKMEPLVYEEAQRNFIENIEEISLEAVKRFFNYLRVQTNYKLAEGNLKNGKENLEIAKTKQRLGLISENDFSRIRLSVLNAEKALNQSSMDLKNADFALKSYIGLEQSGDINLIMPLNMGLFEVDVNKALDEALANRKETPYFKRRLINAERELVEAKKNNGLGATLRGEVGWVNKSPEVQNVYSEAQNSQTIKLSLSVPILDWGRNTSKVKMAESEHALVVYDVEKDKEQFERRVVVQVEQFSLLKDQLATSAEADQVAENGYMIALKRFQNGEITINDLNISLSEREKAKRDYINTLEDYWRAYFNLRILTLYDFEFDRKIEYSNPMLADEIN